MQHEIPQQAEIEIRVFSELILMYQYIIRMYSYAIGVKKEKNTLDTRILIQQRNPRNRSQITYLLIAISGYKNANSIESVLNAHIREIASTGINEHAVSYVNTQNVRVQRHKTPGV